MKEFEEELDKRINQKSAARDSGRETREKEKKKQLEVQQNLQERWIAESKRLASLGNEQLLPLIRVFSEKTGKKAPDGLRIKPPGKLTGYMDFTQYSVNQEIVLRRDKPLGGGVKRNMAEWGEWEKPHSVGSVTTKKASTLGGLGASSYLPGTYLNFEITTNTSGHPFCTVVCESEGKTETLGIVRLDNKPEDIQNTMLDIFEKIL